MEAIKKRHPNAMLSQSHAMPCVPIAINHKHKSEKKVKSSSTSLVFIKPASAQACREAMGAQPGQLSQLSQVVRTSWTSWPSSRIATICSDG